MKNPNPSPTFLPKYPCVESMCATCPFHPSGEGYARNHPDFPAILKGIENGMPFFCHGTVLEHGKTRFALDMVGEPFPSPPIQSHFKSCLGAVRYKQGKIDLAPPKKGRKRRMGAKQVAEWTIATVKEELPNVTVKDGETVYEAWVRGRRNKFAGVSWGDKKQYTVEVAWETIVHCLNFGKPINVS